MAPMTRAEGLALCNNILDLLECMEERMRDKAATFLTGVRDRTNSIRQTILRNAQYTIIHENTAKTLLNSWKGVRKWDRANEFNDEMLFGLTAAQQELDEADEDDKDFSVTEEGDVAAPKSGASVKNAIVEPEFDFQKKARESPAFKAAQAAAEARQEAYAATQQRKALQSTTTKNTVRVETHQPTLTPSDITKMRDTWISVALNQAEQKQIRVVDENTIRHGDLGNIVNQTKSDRTQQLIYAAFYGGKVAGIKMLAEDIIALINKKGP